MRLHLAHLYPHTMNTYGDSGNIICLVQRCAWRDIEVLVHPLDIGDALPPEIDLYFFGGGQDAAQSTLEKDLHQRAERILEDCQNGTPLLAICGGYQLLGKSYTPFKDDPIQGVGLFPVETQASNDRMIGDLIIKADPYFGFSENSPTIVGFENHSGKTTMVDSDAARPLGTVLHGHGNNGSDSTEGCVTNNAIGCYLHGSLLPKNPHLADWLIQRALNKKDNSLRLQPLDDSIAWQAHHTIAGRYM